MTTVCHITCDICGRNIDKKGGYVDATPYEAHFHTECVTDEMILFAAHLDLDDIDIIDDYGVRDRMVYSNRAEHILEMTKTGISTKG